MLRDWRSNIAKYLSPRVIIGGPLGIFAWSISGASAVAIAIWGLKTVALPLVMLKTASWSIWGFGVLKESRQRKR